MKTIKIKIPLALFFLLSLTRLSAQSNTVASGGEATGSGGNGSFTAGEVFYTYKSGSTGSVTEGMQQTDPIIIFNANGGTGTMSNQFMSYLASANLITNTFTRAGYNFAGWATTVTGTVAYADGASYTMSGTADVTLYAQWTLIVAPEAPVNLVATVPCDDQIEINFTAGADGGSPITNYEYTLDGTMWTAFSPAVTGTTVTVTDLTEGTTYTIQLRAVNAIGSGASATVTATINSAAIIYWGGTLMHTNSKSGVITLAAKVVLPVGADATQSQLRFLNRGTNQPISVWLPVNLVLANESHIGLASYQYSVTLGPAETERNITIGFELGGPNSCFTRNDVIDNVSITVKEVNSCGCN
jgi:uncharacterized repeat protein (TIGR02543 family)